MATFLSAELSTIVRYFINNYWLFKHEEISTKGFLYYHVANLGAFIKPEYRDITYFHGIDYHQDIIDYKDRLTDFITLYVYLDDVTENDAPLFLLPESHKAGATTFPHDLVKVNDKYIYNQNQELNEIVLTGPAGTTYFWHSTTLHGTQPTKTSSPRISLRYLISKHRSHKYHFSQLFEMLLKI